MRSSASTSSSRQVCRRVHAVTGYGGGGAHVIVWHWHHTDLGLGSPTLSTVFHVYELRWFPQYSDECKVRAEYSPWRGSGVSIILGLGSPSAQIHVFYQYHLLVAHGVFGSTKERCDGSVNHLLEKPTNHCVLQSFTGLFEVGIGIHL